ncbi:MAG: SIR2 family protein [Acidimicrobiaceae bacterium]|nr:SIR2 family protein [Acidimicrobiaceae bacterium]MCY3608343.1 SIR2 family protein [Acidimicrobiaceae bacterium]
MIVTTNFDRLLETALAEAGVHPQVISNAATAQSAEPLQHSRCTVIKVNGDYVSSDIRNTTDELDVYEPAIDSLLSRVFGEYGLIVCGWSASLDTALREAILSASNRRYSTFWMDRGNLTAEAAEIVTRRSAIRVPIEDADSAFEQLADTVAALAQVPQQRPAATTASVQQLKLHMSDPSHHIRLHDLIVQETERLIDNIAELPTSGVDLNAVFPERVHRYEAASAPMMSLLATGAFFSRSDEHDQIWVTVVDRLARREIAQAGYNDLLQMQQYPTLLTMYAVAFGAAAAGRIDPVARILGSVAVVEHGRTVPVGVATSSFQVLDYDRMRATVPGYERHRVPFSQRLFDVLRPTVTEIIRDDQRYKELFDQIEYLFGLACYAGIGVGPIGVGAHRRLVGPIEPPDRLVQGNREVLIEAGVFTDAANLEACRAAYNEEFRNTSKRPW